MPLRPFLIFVAGVMISGCGAFLSLSDKDDDPPINVASQGGDGAVVQPPPGDGPDASDGGLAEDGGDAGTKTGRTVECDKIESSGEFDDKASCVSERTNLDCVLGGKIPENGASCLPLLVGKQRTFCEDCIERPADGKFSYAYARCTCE